MDPIQRRPGGHPGRPARVPGDNSFVAAAEFLASVSSLVHVPHLSTASSVATKVASGAKTLLGGDRTRAYVAVRRSLHDEDVTNGYYVLANADSADFSPGDYGIDADRALVSKKTGKPVEGIDYLVLEMEVRTGIGDEWQNIASIAGPYNEAVRAALDPQDGDKRRFEALLASAMIAARTCPDLTFSDRKIVAAEIAKEWDTWRSSQRTVSGSGGWGADPAHE